jgi:hypothetical protein
MSQVANPFAAPIPPVSPLQSTPINVPTAGSQQEALAERAKVTGFKNSVTGLFDKELWGAAFDNDVVAMLVRQVSRSGFDPQPGYSITPARLQELSRDIDPEFHAMFGESVSDLNAQYIRSQALQLTESKRKLMQAGHSGTFASITAAIVNPANLASMGAGYAVGAVRGGVTATQATRASRVYEAARMGFANAAVSAPINAYRASQDPNYRGVDAVIDTATDVAFGGAGPYIGESSAFARFAIGGSVAAGVPFLGYSLTPEQEMQESTAMLMLQFGIGGGLSAAFGRTRLDDGIESAAYKTDRRTTAMAVDEAGGLSDAGKAQYADVFGPEHDDNLMASVARATGLEDSEADAIIAKVDVSYPERPVRADADVFGRINDRLTPQSDTGGQGRTTAMGAAGQYGIRLTSAAPAPAHNIVGGFDASSIDDRSAWGVLSKDLGGKVTVSPNRWTMFDLTSQTPVDEHRVLANGLMTHTLLRRGEMPGSKTMSHISGVEQVERAMRERWTPVQQDVRAEWAAFLADAKKNGQVNIGNRFINLRDANGNINLKTAMQADPGTFSYTGFQQQVGREARRAIEGLPASNPFARRAAERYIAFAKEIGEFAKAHGVRGAETLDTTKMYMPRSWSRQALDNAATEHGQDVVVRTLADAILPRLGNQMNAGVPLPPATMDELAVAMAKAIFNNAGTLKSPHGLIPLARTDFDRIVRGIVPNISDTELGTLRAQLTPPDDSDVLSMLRSRVPLDELYVGPTPNGKQIAIEDLLLNDAQSLYHGYARKMMGGAMIAELERVMRYKFDDDSIDLQTLSEFRAFTRKAAQREGIDNEGNLARLEAAYRSVSGLPMQDVDTAGKAIYHSAVRTIMSLNFMRSLSGLVSGIANVGDVVRAIASPETGLRATYKSFPALRDLVDATIKGEPPKGIIAAAYRAGLATGRVTGSSSLRDPNLGEVDGALQKVEFAARFGARAGAYTSLQQPVADMGDAILYAGFVQKLHDNAPSLSENRILALGINSGEYTEIAAKIRQFAIKDPSGVIIDPNEGAWGDAALATKFRNASNRFVRRATNQGDSTMMTRFFGNTVEGKMLLQFRTYAFRGMETQMMFNLQMGDAAGYISFLTGSASATMMYVAGVWVNSVGRPDAEEYRRRMLSETSIAKAAVGRAAWAGLLPMFTDAAIALGDGSPVFAPQRISGLGTDNGVKGLLLGNPTFDWIDNALGAFSTVRAPLDPDYDFSQRNAKTLQNALWIPNAANLRNFINSALNDLPERSENE